MQDRVILFYPELVNVLGKSPHLPISPSPHPNSLPTHKIRLTPSLANQPNILNLHGFF